MKKETKKEIKNNSYNVFKSLGFKKNEVKEIQDLLNYILFGKIILYNKIFTKRFEFNNKKTNVKNKKENEKSNKETLNKNNITIN